MADLVVPTPRYKLDGECIAEVDPARKPTTIVCKLCYQLAAAELAHRHQGESVGACCWDARLETTQ